MKGKKIVSLLCSAAMSVSAFAGLAVTASAADTVLWSDTFDFQRTGIFLDGTEVNGATDAYTISGLTFVTTNRNGGDRGVYVDNAGDTVYTGSLYSVEEKTESDKYLHLSYPIFGDYARQGRYAHVDFEETYAADAATDVVMDFDLKLTDGMVKGQHSDDYSNPILRIGSFNPTAKTATAVAIDKAAAGIGSDWVDARIIVSNTTGAKLYINGQEITSAANANVKSLSSIGLYFKDVATLGNMTPPLDAKSDWLNAQTPTLTPQADMDNVVIYTSAAGETTGTSTAPAATAQNPGERPTVYAPATELASGATPMFINNFNGAAPSGMYDANRFVILNTSADNSTFKGYAPFYLGCGTKNEAQGATNWSLIANPDAAIDVTDNYITAVSANDSNGNRGPRMWVKATTDNLEENQVIGATFAARLHANGTTAPAEIVFSADYSANSSNLLVNAVAKITTDDTVKDGDTNTSMSTVKVDDNKWFVVDMKMGADKQVTITVDGEELYTGDVRTDLKTSSTAVNTLPSVSFKNHRTNSSNTRVDIDNVIVYTTGKCENPYPPSITEVKAQAQNVLITSESEYDADAVVIHASYNSDKTLKSLKSYPVTIEAAKTTTLEIPAEDTIYSDDKIMLWGSLKGMVPYYNKAVAITGAVEAPTPSPTPDVTASPSPTPDVSTPTASPSPTPDVSTPTASPSPTPTASPSPTPTPVPDYTVTVTADAGITDVKLGEKTATKSGNTYTFSDVTAGSYTLNVTYAAEYEKADNSAESVTVTNTDVQVTITSKLKTYTVTGTVTENAIKSVTLTNKNDNTKIYRGEINAATVTFNNVPAGEYAVTAELNDDYKDAVIQNADYTVSSTATSIGSITASAKVKSAVTASVVDDEGTASANANVTINPNTATIAEGTQVTVSAGAVNTSTHYVSKIVVAKGSEEITSVENATQAVFTMPAEAVTVTVTVSERADTEPATIVKAAPTGNVSVIQGTQVTIGVRVLDAAGKATTKNGVTFAVSGNTSQDTTVVEGENNTAVLTVGADETSTDLKVVVTSTEVSTVKLEIPVTVTPAYVQQTLTFNYPGNRGVIAGATVTAEALDTLNANSMPVALAEVVGSETLSGVTDENGQVTLALSPLNTYSLKAVKAGVTIYTNNNFALTTSSPETAVINVPAVETTVPAEANGNSVALSPVEAVAGDSVTITPTTGANYICTGVTVTAKSDSSAVSVTNDNGIYTFTMPAGGVTITPTFVEVYDVTITADAGISNVKLGTIEGTKGDNNTYTFTKVPVGEYTFDVSYEDGYVKADNSATSITVSANKTSETISSQANTFTVIITADAGIKNVKLGTLEGTKGDNNTYTFANVPAGEYTFDVEYNEGYVKADNSATSITVSANKISETIASKQITAAVTFEQAANGTLTVKNGNDAITSGDAIAYGTVLTVVAVPNPGYEVATLTYTVGSGQPVDIKDADTKTITVGAEAITISASFAERAYADGELKGATYISRNGKIGDQGATLETVTADANANYSTTGELLVGNPGNWARVGLIKFAATVDADDAAPIYRAYLKLTQKAIDTRLDNGFEVSSVVGDYDPTTITFVNVYGTACIEDGSKAAIQENSPITGFNSIVQIGKNPSNQGDNLTSAADGFVYNVDVTDYVKSVKAAKGTTYSLALNKSRRGMSFYGYASAHEPVLEITRGINAAFTVQAAANAETKIANAVIEVKEGDTVVATATTDSNGSATVVLLPNKSYTYTVTSADYAIKKDGTLTTTEAAITETVSLAANVPTTVEITSPETTIVTLDATATFTATVKDQDGRVMNNVPLTWSIVDNPANISVTDGVVSATTGVTGGNYQVKAAVTSNDAVSATADFTVNVSSPATVTVKYQTAEGAALKADDTVTENLFVGDSFTLADTYLADVRKNNDDNTFSIYTYNAEDSTITIDALESTNEVIVKFVTDGKKFYVKEDFSTVTGDWGFNERIGKNNSAGSATVSDGKLRVSTNTNYNSTDTNEASMSKTFGSPYTGKIEISFKISNDGTANKGSTLYLYDNAETPAEVTSVKLMHTANNGSTINGTVYNSPTCTDAGRNRYQGDTIDCRFVVDFTNHTVEAYVNGAKFGDTKTITAVNFAKMKVKGDNSATNMFIDDFVIEKLS